MLLTKRKVQCIALALIQYVGDDSIAVCSIYGISKRKDVLFTQILPSTYKTLTQKCLVDEPSNVYKSAPPHLKPRNAKQCQNINSFLNKQKLFSSDELLNMNVLHLNIGFVKQILSVPDVRII